MDRAPGEEGQRGEGEKGMRNNPPCPAKTARDKGGPPKPKTAREKGGPPKPRTARDKGGATCSPGSDKGG
ncbi:MAG: hypothetical protein WCC59_17315, partial [Terriglobales bacterium]